MEVKPDLNQEIPPIGNRDDIHIVPSLLSDKSGQPKFYVGPDLRLNFVYFI
jgi:uncharacterized protein YcgL (UPF0745 family)